MFLGHFGMAMGAKAVAPGPSLGTTIMAAQWADGIWPVFVLLGLENVAIAAGVARALSDRALPSTIGFDARWADLLTRVTPLDFVSYPYTHSLVADIVWAALFALVYGGLRRDWRGAFWLAALVLSHWVLDVVAHRPDMPIWPDGPKVGLGLWNSLPATLVVEFALFGIGAWLYARAAPARDRIGTVSFRAFVAALTIIYLASVFGPPPPSERALAITGVLGWLFVAWGYWIERHRSVAV